MKVFRKITKNNYPDIYKNLVKSLKGKGTLYSRFFYGKNTLKSTTETLEKYKNEFSSVRKGEEVLLGPKTPLEAKIYLRPKKFNDLGNIRIPESGIWYEGDKEAIFKIGKNGGKGDLAYINMEDEISLGPYGILVKTKGPYEGTKEENPAVLSITYN